MKSFGCENTSASKCPAEGEYATVVPAGMSTPHRVSGAITRRCDSRFGECRRSASVTTARSIGSASASVKRSGRLAAPRASIVARRAEPGAWASSIRDQVIRLAVVSRAAIRSASR